MPTPALYPALGARTASASAQGLSARIDSIGRGQRPAQLVGLDIVADQKTIPLQDGANVSTAQPEKSAPLAPIVHATVHGVAVDGVGYAAISGRLGDGMALDLVNLDEGRLVWRDTTVCTAPVVGVFEGAIVCSDGHGTRAIATDGKLRWRSEGIARGMSGSYVAIAAGSQTQLIDVRTGSGVATFASELAANQFVAGCRSGDEWRMIWFDGQGLVMSTERGATKRATVPVARPVWNHPFAASDGSCEAVWTILDERGTLTSIRNELQFVAAIAGVTGVVPHRNNFVVSAHNHVRTVSAQLQTIPGPTLPVFGPVVASFANRVLLRKSQRSMLLVDLDQGQWQQLALALPTAALSNKSVLASDPFAGAHSLPRAFQLPATLDSRWPTSPFPTVVKPAELRDLPAPVELSSQPVLASGGELSSVVALAFDLQRPELLYVMNTKGQVRATPDPSNVVAEVRAFDLGEKSWLWRAEQGCGSGEPISMAATARGVVCATQSERHVQVVATSDTGAKLWQWQGEAGSAVIANRDTVLVVAHQSATVLSVASGAKLFELASTDGGYPRVALATIDGHSTVVNATSHALEFHPLGDAANSRPGSLQPWSIPVAGSIANVQATADGALVIVSFEDGDRFAFDATTKQIFSLIEQADQVVIAGPTIAMASVVRDGALSVRVIDRAGATRSRNDYLLELIVPAPAVAPLPPPRLPPRSRWRRTLPTRGAQAPIPPRILRYQPVLAPVASGAQPNLVFDFAHGYALVTNGANGDPLQLVKLQAGNNGFHFSSDLGNRKMTGTVGSNPLAIQLF